MANYNLENFGFSNLARVIYIYIYDDSYTSFLQSEIWRKKKTTKTIITRTNKLLLEKRLKRWQTVLQVKASPIINLKA